MAEELCHGHFQHFACARRTRFGQREGGYTRIARLPLPLNSRRNDGAEMAILELVGSELVKRAAERAKRREERLQAMKEGKEEGEE